MAAATAAYSSSRQIPDVIEHIGLGWAQIKATMIGGGVWMADGAELLLIGTVTRAVAEDWELVSWQRGLIVSVVFIGIFAGNIMSGIVGDACGRRLPITVSYAMVFIFSVLSAAAPNVWFLMLIRLIVGFGFGFGQPAWTALCTEITPADSRILMNSGSQLLFTLGELYSGLLVLYQDPYMVHLSWRKLLAMGAAPSLFMFLFSFRLLESPSYLALHDDYEGAKRNLKKLGRDNGMDAMADEDFDFQPPASIKSQDSSVKMYNALSILAGEKLLYSTFTMIYSCLVMNVLFYGCLYCFPQIVTDVDMAQTPAMTLVVGALWEIPGYVIAYISGVVFERRIAVMVYFLTAAVSLAAFTVGGHHNSGTTWGLFLTNFGYMGIKLFTCVGFVNIYQYTTEIYPTVARGTGTALCFAGGRIGGMVAPLLFEETKRISGDWGAFFNIMILMTLINFMLVAMMPHKCVKRLSDHDDGEDVHSGTPLPPPPFDKSA